MSFPPLGERVLVTFANGSEAVGYTRKTPLRGLCWVIPFQRRICKTHDILQWRNINPGACACHPED